MPHWIVIHIGILVLMAVAAWSAVVWLGVPGFAGAGIILTACLGWVSFLVFRHLQKRNKPSVSTEPSQAESSEASRKSQIESLRLEFERAIAALKDSTQKGNFANDPPWFLVLGPPASGKTTLMLQAGLEFPILGQKGKAGSVIRGTINCDWWFAKEGVFLDTAGRYVSQEKDRQEWLSFIDLLQRYRKGKSINGVLVVVDVGDIITQNAEQLDLHAHNIRNRLNELIQRLGTIFPVYLVFTKCDLMQGFVEFFENLSRHDREEMWGCTFSRGAESEAPAHKRFQSEMQLLVDTLEPRVAGRLMAAQGAEQAKNIFSFPFQLRCLEERVVRFVEQLFQPSAFQQNPTFRGFYFASSVQPGGSFDSALTAFATSVGIEVRQNGSGKESREPRSFFIKNLFTEVLFKDGALAGPSFATTRYRRTARILVLAGSLLVAVASVGWFAFSYMRNKEITEQFLATEKQTVLVTSSGFRHFGRNVKILDDFRDRLDGLAAYHINGVPLRISGGLYRGNELYEPAKELYFYLFNSLYLTQTQNTIEAELRHFTSAPSTGLDTSGDTDKHYSLLKLYLMMTDPSHFDPAYVSDRLKQLWDELLFHQYGNDIPRDVSSAVHAQINSYVRSVNDHRVPLESIDRPLVSRAQEALRRVPLPARYFARIKRDATTLKESIQKSEAYTLDKALAGQRQVLLANKVSIPALFTPEGWKIIFPLSLDKVLREAGSEGWVLNVEEVPSREMKAAVENLYLEEYARHWRRFIQETKILPAENLPDILNRLEILSRKNSQLVIVLRDVDRNTWLSNPLEQSANKLISVISNEKMERMVHRNPVQAVFESFHDFVAAGIEAKESGLDRYVSELGKAANAMTVLAQPDSAVQDSKDTKDLRQARLNTEVLLRQLDKDIRDDLRPLLIQPFLVAQATASKGEIEGLNQILKQEVSRRCFQSVAGKYPFRKGGQAGDEVSFADFSAYFHPQGGTFWKFYQAKLQPAVQEEAGRWVVKTSDLPIAPGFLDVLYHTDLITQGFFGKGSPEPRVSFDIRPNGVPGVDEIRLMVDGRDLLYRNEKEEWHQFIWPGTTENSGAAIEVLFGGSKEPLSLKFDGRWGFFKMLDAGRVVQVGPTEYGLEWTVTPTGGTPAKIKFDLRTDSPKNPFVPGLFSKFRCPSQVGL